MILNRRYSLAVITIITAATLAGCASGGGTSSNGEATGSQRTLTVFEKWPEPQHAAYFEKIVADFEAANPGVTVELTAVQDEPYKERIRVLTASNELTDVFFAWPGKYGEQFLKAGLAEDLTDELEEDGWGDTIAPGSLDAYTVDGQTYGIPINQSGKYFIYNKALFEQADVEVPATLDELLEACRAFRSAGIQPISFGNQAGWPGVHYLTTLFAKYVPAEVRAEDYEPSTAEFDHPGYEQALETLTELSEECFTHGANGISNDSTKAEMQTGGAAMAYLETNNFYLFMEEGGASPEVAANWGFFRFPDIEGADGDAEALTGAPDGFLVNAKSPNKDLAVEFLRFLTSTENARMQVEMRQRPTTVIGADQGVDIIPQLADAIADMNSTSNFSIWLDTATAPPVATAMLAGAQAAVEGATSPDDILESIRTASEQAK